MKLNHYLIGGHVIVIATCSVVDPLTDESTDTTPTTAIFYRVDPNGVLTQYNYPGSPEVVLLATGIIGCTVAVEVVGIEKWRYESLGACAAVAEGEFEVLASNVL